MDAHKINGPRFHSIYFQTAMMISICLYASTHIIHCMGCPPYKKKAVKNPPPISGFFLGEDKSNKGILERNQNVIKNPPPQSREIFCQGGGS